MNIVYGELRRRAAMFMAHELVQQDISWPGRAHFFAVAAQVMRNLLVDSARARRANKRGGAYHQVTLDDAVAFKEARAIDLGSNGSFMASSTACLWADLQAIFISCL
jgi:hypothetical protein